MTVALFWMCVGLLAGLGVVVYIIAADKKRFLVRFDLSLWQDKHYLQTLPNFLQALHDNHFKTPWPAAHHAVAVGHFHFRTWILRKRSGSMRRPFVEQHVILFALLEVLRPFIADFILNEQQRIVGQRVLEMEDTIDRDKLMAFLDGAREVRAQLFSSLTPPERYTLAQMIDRRFIPTLKMAHSIFQEHGYSLLPEFTQLRQWGDMTGSELAQELPTLPVIKHTHQPQPTRESLARRP